MNLCYRWMDFSSLGRVFAALAMVMLVFAGAKFTHFDSDGHQHTLTDQSIAPDGTHDHSHGTVPEEQHGTQALHCGANILTLTEHYEVQGTCINASHFAVGAIAFSENSLGFDPPPPRAIS